jgi:PAS domain S-box-containing protein
MVPSRIDRPLLGLSIIVIAILGVAAFVSWRATQQVIDAARQERKVLLDATAVFSALEDSETGQRGFLLTGEESYLAPYRDGVGAFRGVMDQLASDVRSDRQEVAAAERIRELSRVKLDELAETIRLRHEQGLAAALAVVRAGAGKSAMDSLRIELGRIRRLESDRMQERERSIDSASSRNLWLILAGLAGIAAVVLVLQRVVDGGIRTRDELAARLLESKQSLQVTLMSIGDGVIATDALGNVTLLNPIASKLTGWAPDDAIGQPLDKIFHIVNENTRKLVESPVAKVLQTGQIAGLANHTVLIDRKGRETPIEDSGAPIRGMTGELQGVVLVFRDVGERRRIELDLMRSEQRFRAVAEAMGDVIWTTNADGEMKTGQPAWAAFTGQSFDQYRGFGWTGAIHPDDRIAAVEAWRQAVADRQTFLSEYRLERHDGIFRLFSVCAVPVASEDGAVREWVGVHIDITDERHNQDSVRESDERFRGLATAFSQLVWSSTAEGDLEYTNAIWDEYAGARNEPGSFSDIWQRMIHPDDADAYATRWQEAIQSGKMFETQCRLKRASDGAYRWFLCRRIPVLGRGRHIVRWLGACLDIDDQMRDANELRRANEALQLSNGDLEQFAYAASHDLQEPLRMISLYTQLLRDEYSGQLDDTARSYIGFAVTGAQRMERLLRDLLAYSQVTGVPPPQAERTNASTALRTALENLEALIRQTGAVIHTGELPVVQVPRLHLTQLFQNLVGNALKYSGENLPKVWIRAEYEQDHWRFAVKDNGIGIEPQYTKQVFGVFKRLHGPEYEGTGIGLAVCQRIVERNGGRIWIESTPGQGATFHFTLRG